MCWSVYMVKCCDGSVYTGIAKDVIKRVAAHNSGRGAKYTRTRRPVKLFWHTAPMTLSEALKLEHKLKRLSHAEKIKLTYEQSCPRSGY
jgi:putative endonuclease